ncbi:MAG: FtsX-like permease family protein [Solobacterium sp.]|nr:FtsX-like permease family protein [Solobacterium sp.]
MVKIPHTLLKNILRLIRQTKGRFFAITAIVTLGVAFFVGVSSSSLVMDASVDQYMDQTAMKDITIYSNYGFDEDDLNAVRNCEGVRTAEGAYFTDVMGSSENLTFVTRVHSYRSDSTLNSFVLREGRMPLNENEALAEAGTTLEPGFPIGSKVLLTMPDGSENEMLKVREVTVVGNVDTPLYLNLTKENSTLSNQYIRTYLYVPEEAFDSDCYLEISLLTENGEAFDAFSNAYFDYAEEIRMKVETLSESQQKQRYTKLKNDAEEAYAEGHAEYEDGVRKYNEEIAKGEKELRQGEKDLRDGEKEIAAAKKQLKDSEKTVDSEYKKGKAQIADAREEIRRGDQEIRKSQKELDSARKEAEEGAGHIPEIKDGIAQLDSAVKMLEELSAAIRTASSVFDLSEDDIRSIQQVIRDLHKTSRDTPLSELAGDSRMKSLMTALGLSEKDSVEDLVRKLTDVLQNDADGESRAEAFRKTIDELNAERDEVNRQLEELMKEKEPYEKQIRELQAQLKTIDERLEKLEEQYSRYNTIQEEIRNAREQISKMNDAAEQLAGQDPDLSLKELKEIMPESAELIEALGMSDTDTVSDLIRKINEMTDEAGQLAEELGTEGDLILEALDTIDLADLPSEIASLKKQKKELEDTLKKINDGLRQIEEGQKQLDDARKQLEEGRKAAEDGLKTLERKIREARAKIDSGWKEVRRNEKIIRDAKKELADGREKLEKAKEEGLEELEKARQELADARQQIDDMDDPEWTVLDRKSHYATVTYDNTISQMEAIGNVFPVFFILVAALVCLTTMTRMVDEQRGEIGILRALGYTRMQCAGKYLIYAGLATVTGSIAGTVLGLLIFPYIIYNTWKMMYVLPDMLLFVPWKLVAFTTVTFLAAMLFTTWYACSSDTGDVPSQLMRPKAPKLGKNLLIERITFLWKRFSFTWKVTLRNLFRYKKRFAMTVSGVAGCTALLVTGFGIRDSINNMVDIQFYDIYRYSGAAAAEGTAAEEAALLETLKKDPEISSVVRCDSYSAKAYGPDSTLSETVSVEIFKDNAELAKAYDLRTRIGKKELALSDDGVIISEKLSENMKVKAGDTFRMEDTDGIYREVKIAAVTEMYIRHYAFISEAYYRMLTGKMPDKCTFLISTDMEDTRKMQERIVNLEHVTGIEFFDETLNNFNTMVKSLDLIVWTLIISSMSLAFVVLGNLINVNISERQREIATLKVLGFRQREVRNYIYKENNILTMIGALAGLPLGNLLHHYIMRMVEMDYIMFGRSILPASFIQATVLTVVFGLLVNLFMAKKLVNIKMVESLKSVE